MPARLKQNFFYTLIIDDEGDFASQGQKANYLAIAHAVLRQAMRVAAGGCES
jgi:hypothetical protein